MPTCSPFTAALPAPARRSLPGIENVRRMSLYVTLVGLLVVSYMHFIAAASAAAESDVIAG